MPKANRATGKTRHDPLYVQLKEDELHEKYGTVSQPGKRKKTRSSEVNEEEGGEVRVLSRYTGLQLTFCEGDP